MRARLATEMMQSGGSSEPDMKALAVMPRISPSASAVITVTPLAKRPMTRRKCAGSISPTRSCSSHPFSPQDAVCQLRRIA